jgi:hypothetical protein
MKRKIWLLIGAAFGLLIPVLLNVVPHIAHGWARPPVYFIFEPALLALQPFSRFLQGTARPLQAFLTMGLNSLLCGLEAAGLRRFFLVLIVVLLAICYIALPPSDARLERRFVRQRQELERLIAKAAETPSISRIGNLEIEDISGTKYKVADKQTIISPDSWREYREAFQKTRMMEGFYRYPTIGEIQFAARPFLSKVGPVETFYGYLYCPPSPPEQQPVYLPCRDRKPEWEDIEYRYKRIDSEWYVVKIFQRRLHRPSSE